MWLSGVCLGSWEKSRGLGQHWLLLLLSQNLPFTKAETWPPRGRVHLRGHCQAVADTGADSGKCWHGSGGAYPVPNRSEGRTIQTHSSVSVTPKHKKGTNGHGMDSSAQTRAPWAYKWAGALGQRKVWPARQAGPSVGLHKLTALRNPHSA